MEVTDLALISVSWLQLIPCCPAKIPGQFPFLQAWKEVQTLRNSCQFWRGSAYVRRDKGRCAFRAHSSVDLIGTLQREWRDTVQVTLRWLLACCPRGRQKETLTSLSWPAVCHLLAWTSVFGAKWAPGRCEWLKPTLPTVGFKIAWRFLTWKRKLTLLYF